LRPSLAVLGTVAMATNLMPMSSGAYFVPVALALLAAVLAICLMTLNGGKTAYLVLLGIMLVGLSINFRHRAAGEIGLDFQNAGKMIGWMVALGVGIWHFGKIRDLLRQPHIASMVIYCVLATLSALWSEAPMFSLANGIGLLAFCVFGLTGAALVSGRKLVTGCVAALSLYLVINIVVALILPDYGYLAPSEFETVYRLRGVSGHPNVLAQQMSVLLGLLFICFNRKWLGRGLILVLAAAVLGMLWLTNSRANLVAVFVSVGLIILRRRPALLIVGLMGSVLALLTVFAIPENLLNDLVGQFSRNGSASEILTLTGRTELWEFCFGKIRERPLFGYGYMAAEDIITREYVSSSYGSTANAHNMMIQSLLSVGILGTLPVLVIFGCHIALFIKRPEPMRDVFGMLLIFSGLTEIEIFGSVAGAYALSYFCVIAASAAQDLRRPRTTGYPALSSSSATNEASPV
jgi:O-antigen ligase